MKDKSCTYVINDILSTGIPAGDFCSTVFYNPKIVSKVGACLFVDGTSEETTVNLIKNTDCKEGQTCACIKEFRFINIYGVQDIYVVKCADEEKIDLDFSSYDICSCDFPLGTSCIYDATYTKSFSVITFEMNTEQEKNFFEEFLLAPQKQVKDPIKNKKGEITGYIWRDVVLSGNSFTKLLKDESFKAELEFVYPKSIAGITK